MKLSKKFRNRNPDGMFRVILLIYRKKYEKMCQNLCRIIYGVL